MPLNCRRDPVPDVVSYIACEVHRILRTAKLRRIGKFKIHKVVNGETGSNGGGEDVDSLVNAVGAYGLSSIDSAGNFVENYFQSHPLGTWIVPSVTSWMKVNHLDVQTCRQGCSFAESCDCGYHTERSYDGGAQRLAISHMAPRNDVGNDATVVICQIGQGNQTIIASKELWLLDCITSGKNVCITGLKGFIHLDAAMSGHLETGSLSEPRLWLHTSGSKDSIGSQSLASI